MNKLVKDSNDAVRSEVQHFHKLSHSRPAGPLSSRNLHLARPSLAPSHRHSAASRSSSASAPTL